MGAALFSNVHAQKKLVIYEQKHVQLHKNMLECVAFVLRYLS